MESNSTPLENWLSLLKSTAKKKNISQAEIADKSGISKSYISEIFSGKKEPKFSKVISIMLVLGIVPIIEFKTAENG